ncbi:MAG: aldo/keto reductase [Gemmatimonadetes bacterium]|nr:aldo/keto reductase [Gemmatimonadota bacterium]
MTDELTRRDFVKMGLAGAAGLAAVPAVAAAGTTPLAVPTRPLGRTGHHPFIFSLGGQASLEQADKHDVSIAIINRAIDLGVNYIDTAAAYGRPRDASKQRWELDGISQTFIGEVMATRRKEVYLATKADDRTKDGALRQLDQSLRLLKTDHLDLWQIHNVQSDAQIEQIFGAGGVIEAMNSAKEQKIVRHVGITGHFDPAVLARALNRYPFDTILMSLNAADKHHLPFTEELLPLANRLQMGVIGMKIPARDRLFKDGAVNTMKEALGYVLTLPVSTVIIGCKTVEQLEENIAIAKAFKPLPAAEMARIEALAANNVGPSNWFKRPPVASGAAEDDQNME